METSTIVNVLLTHIDANPFRLPTKYPYVESKVETLQRSIAAVGFWEGVLGRQSGNRVQIAFGHHRIEAARRNGLKSIPLVVRELSDEQMLMFMGRENDEDYNSDFLCMLETWEAAHHWLTEQGEGTTRLEVARLLGWSRVNPRTEAGDRPSVAADACDLAYQAILEGTFTRDDFKEMTVSTVSNLVQTHKGQQKLVDKAAEEFKWDDSKVKKTKAALSDAVKQTAKAVREGEVASSYHHVKAAITDKFMTKEVTKRDKHLLNKYLDDLRKRVDSMLTNDHVAAQLNDLAKRLPALVDDLDDHDRAGLAALALSFMSLSKRSTINANRLDVKKITHIPALKALR